MTTISLCMMVKNEEENIEKCLDSIKPFVDELIVVDTGSIDRTPELALSRGAKIYYVEWEDNFSEIRNFALDKARGKWVLFLDGDEWLEGGERLKEILQNVPEEVEGFLVEIRNYSDEGRNRFEKNYYPRLLKNNKKIRFQGALHEGPALEGTEVEFSPLIIHHDGYIASIQEKKKKSERNLRILLKEMESHPLDPFLYYNLGCEFSRVHNYSEAILSFLESLRLVKEEGKRGFEPRLYKMLIMSYLEMNRLDEGLRIADEAIDEYSDFPDLYYLRAHVKEQKKEWNGALEDFLQCILLSQPLFSVPYQYTLEEGVSGFLSYYCMGRIFSKMGKRLETLHAYTRSYLDCPTFLPALIQIKDWFAPNFHDMALYFQNKILIENMDIEKIHLADFFMEREEKDCALAFLQSINASEVSTEICLAVGERMEAMARFEEMASWFSERDYSRGLDSSFAHYICGLFLSGNKGKAKKILAKSENPGIVYSSVARFILQDALNKSEEGIKKFPDSVLLRSQCEKIRQVKAFVTS